MTFRLVTILYLFALLAASLAVIGVWGILVAALVFGTWSARSHSQSWWYALRFSWGLLLLLLLAVLLAPAVTDVRQMSLRNLSLSHSKQLLLAIHNYENAHGHLPPPYVTDAKGTPLYSWRVAILPFIEGDKTNKKLHLDEPWNSPHNRPLLDEVDASLFVSPRTRRDKYENGTTDYVAVVDPATAWPPNSTANLLSAVDGITQTIAIIEVGGRGIHWAEPRDVTLDEAVDLLTGQSSHVDELVTEGYFTTNVYELQMRVVGFLDGRAEIVGPVGDRDDALALLTKAGGETIANDYGQDLSPKRRHIRTIVHWGHVWGVAVWLALVLLPSVPAARRKIWPTSKEVFPG